MDEIIKPGTIVKFKKDFASLPNGIVKGVWMNNQGAEYQIMYFHNGDFKLAYIPKEMWEPVYGESLPVGFQLTKQN